MQKRVLQYEVEVMAFHTAIFIVIFPANNLLSMTLIPSIFVETIKGIPSYPKEDMDFYIDSISLHQGFKFFNKILKSRYGVEFESKKGKQSLEPYSFLKGGTGLLIKLCTKEFIGVGHDKRMLHLISHRNALLEAVVATRNVLLSLSD